MNMGPYFSDDNDYQNLATHFLAFIAVGINSRWELVLSYFAIDSVYVSANKPTFLINLLLLHDIGGEVASMIFHGAATNISTYRIMVGADFSYSKPSFQP